jgi:hypothetical protein
MENSFNDATGSLKNNKSALKNEAIDGLNIKILVKIQNEFMYIIETENEGKCVYDPNTLNIYQLEYYNDKNNYQIKSLNQEDAIGKVHNKKIMFYEACFPLYPIGKNPYKDMATKKDVKAELKYISIMNKEIQYYRQRIIELQNIKDIQSAQNKKQRETIKKISNELFYTKLKTNEKMTCTIGVQTETTETKIIELTDIDDDLSDTNSEFDNSSDEIDDVLDKIIKLNKC